VVVVLLLLVSAGITFVLEWRDQAHLRSAILHAQEALRVAERIRTSVVSQYNKQPVYDFFERAPVSAFNKRYRTALQEESHYGTKFYIQITRENAGSTVQTYSVVDVVVKGKVSPLGAVATPLGENTRLIFYSEPEFGRNNYIIGSAQSEKAVWFKEETR
jgi:hypothetical protein